MGIFGWNLPPGCGKLPGEEDTPCEVCGQFDNDCICEECLECGCVGDSRCYEKHGMVRSQEQIDLLKKAELSWQTNNENEYFRQQLDYIPTEEEIKENQENVNENIKEFEKYWNGLLKHED